MEINAQFDGMNREMNESALKLLNKFCFVYKSHAFYDLERAIFRIKTSHIGIEIEFEF